MKAWHFIGATLRDGQPVPADDETLVHAGPLVMCVSGLHASRRVLDALKYAPGSTVCRVEVGGEMVEDTDKVVARERTILWRIDATDLLCDFARRCALDVIDLWDAPVVRRYLGDEASRNAAWDAARAAAWDAAWAAAWDAARPAAWDAAWDAALAAARDHQNRRLTSMVMAARRKGDHDAGGGR